MNMAVALGPVLDVPLGTPWLFFLVEIFATCGIIQLIQRILDPSDIATFVEEFFCVAQTVILSYESGVLRAAYGDLAYAAGIFISTFIYSRTFRRGIFTNLAGNVHIYSHQGIWPWFELLVHLATQIFAAWSAVQYLKVIWSFNGLDAFHKTKLDKLSSCTSDIQTGLPQALITELLLTFVFRMIIHRERSFRSGMGLVALTAVACTFAGLQLTGGYFNPTVAFSMQFGCSGHEHWQFVLVYFVGPVIGAFLTGAFGDKIWQYLPRMLEENL